MNSLRRGWNFFIQALDMARKDPDLLKPSIIGFFVNILVTIVFFIPGVLVFLLAGGTGAFLGEWAGQLILAIFGAGFTLLQYMISYLFAGMTCFLVYQYVTQGDGKMGDAWKVVQRDFLDLLALAFISTLVSIVENFIRSQGRRAGGIANVIAGLVASILETVWTVATYFVLPAMVIEDLHLGNALKRATQIIKGNLLLVAVSEIGVRGIISILSTVLVFIAIGVSVGAFVLFGSLLSTAGFIIGGIIAALVFGLVIAFTTVFGSYITTAYYTMMYIWALEAEQAVAHGQLANSVTAPAAIQAALA